MAINQRIHSKIRKTSPQHKIDWWIVIAVLILVMLGLVMVYSASSIVADRNFNDKYYFLKRQVIFLLVSSTAAIITTYLPRKFLNNLHYVALLGVSFLLLLCLTPLGNEVNGASRWISFGAFSIQPLEFTKIALVLYLAYFMSEKQDKFDDFTLGVLPPFLVTMFLCALVIAQPDFGGAIVLSLILFFMCLVGGTRFLYLFFACLVISLLAAVFLLTSSYRMQRVFAYLDPFKDALDSGYQLVQSLYALGLGGFFGAGIGASKQKLLYLPEAHNDFIMAIIGEEMGFFGITIIMLLFTFLFMRCFRTALGQQELRDKLTAFGITLVIAIGAFFNLAVVIGSVPPTGVAMPFISYGGSSLLCSMICIGLILNYSRTTKEENIDLDSPSYLK